MKYAVVVIMMVVCAVFSAPQHARAGGGHDHNHEAAIEAAPRGGMLRDAPPFKVELLLTNDLAQIYVYDASLSLVASDRLASEIKGRLRFPREKSDREVVFVRKGDAYESTLAGISAVHRFDMHVDIVVDGKTVVGDFGVDNIH